MFESDNFIQLSWDAERPGTNFHLIVREALGGTTLSCLLYVCHLWLVKIQESHGI